MAGPEGRAARSHATRQVINRQEQEMQEKNIPEKTSIRLFFGCGTSAEKNTAAAAAEKAKKSSRQWFEDSPPPRCPGFPLRSNKQRGMRLLLPVQGCWSVYWARRLSRQ